MKCKGYRLNGYDATYTKTTFNIAEQENRVLEITDLEGGTTFLVDLETCETKQEKRVGKWRQTEGDKRGVSISFGSMGFFKKLEYNSKKRR